MSFILVSIRYAVVLFLITCLVAPNAHAYLDPGSGSMMLQMLLAGVAGVALAIKMFWRRILSYFRSSKDTQHDDPKTPS